MTIVKYIGYLESQIANILFAGEQQESQLRMA